MNNYEAKFDNEFQIYNHKALSPMSRFAIGIVAEISPADTVEGDVKKLASLAKGTLGKVRVDFMFGYGKRVRSGWLPYIKRWSHFRKAIKDIDEIEVKDENNPPYVGRGMSDVPRVGTRVLVAFISNSYDNGVVLGCIPDRLNSLPIQWDLEEFKSCDIAHTGPKVGIGVIQRGKEEWQKDDFEAKGEHVVVFKNDLKTKKDDNNEKVGYYVDFDMGEDGDKSSSSLSVVCSNFTLIVDEKMTIESEEEE